MVHFGDRHPIAHIDYTPSHTRSQNLFPRAGRPLPADCKFQSFFEALAFHPAPFTMDGMTRTLLSILVITSCLASVSLAEPPARREVKGGWFAPRAVQTARPVAPKAVFVIPIREDIMPVLLLRLKYKITKARSQGADMVIFDMDTPGGRVDVMNKIVRMIREDLKNVYTVCWVHPQAHSAGALIAMACDEIVMDDHGIIGDAMPILFDGQSLQTLPTAERSKLEAPLRKEVRDLAQRNGYNADLCEGMINTDIILWVIRHRDTNELRIVNHHD